MDERQELELAPRQLVSHVLATHPEGQSLFSEAGHCRALAKQSASEVTLAFTAMQAARLGYEELRHRLDPRRARPVHFGLAMLSLAAIFALLTLLDAIEFAGILTGWMTAAAVAAAVAWTGCAWLAALAVREKQHGARTWIAAAAVTAGLLLAALHGDGRFPGHVHRWFSFGVGMAVALLIFVLVAVAAAIITRTEPASLLVARRRWHHSRDALAAAEQLQRADAEAATVAGQGWRGLVRMQASASADDEEPFTGRGRPAH